jgi:hypothetical protein
LLVCFNWLRNLAPQARQPRGLVSNNMALKPVAAPEAMARRPSNTTGMCSHDVFAIPSFYSCPKPSVLPNSFSVFSQHSTFFCSALEMEVVGSASAVFAVASIAIQLGETIQRLVEFWKTVQDAPTEITDLFDELQFLSIILKKIQDHTPREDLVKIVTKALGDCQSKLASLKNEVSGAVFAVKSGSSCKRKWTAFKYTVKKPRIDALRGSLERALSSLQVVQSIYILCA